MMKVLKYFFIIFTILFLILPVLTLAACEELKGFAEYRDCIQAEKSQAQSDSAVDTQSTINHEIQSARTQTDQVDISCKYGYPWCGREKTDIAGLVKNFYNYALAAVGVAALGAIIFGGVKYTVSAGNPSSQTDAISWITGAVWGLVLLLGANLLLRTINPKLIDMKLTHLESVKVDLYESKYKENTQLYKKLPSTQTFVEASEAYNDRKKKLEQQGLTKEKIAQTLSEEIAIGAQCKKYTNRKDDCIKYANESVSQFYNQQTNKIDYEDFEKTVDKKMVETGNMRWW